MELMTLANIPAIPSGLTVTVYQAGTSNLATLYDRAGAALANPFASDSTGRLEFQAATGKYDVKLGGGAGAPDASWNGGQAFWVYGVFLVDGIPEPSAGDFGKALQVNAAGTGFELVGPMRGFRNILTNGNLSINQRGFGGDWSALADGVYGYDRWKKLGTNIQQVIEAGNYTPGATYTLSGVNVAVQQLTAPVGGNWTITVPNTASNIQLEEGSVVTPLETRPVQIERLLCVRYYRRISAPAGRESLGAGFSYSTMNAAFHIDFPEMRVPPVISAANLIVVRGDGGPLVGTSFNVPFVTEKTALLDVTASGMTGGQGALLNLDTGGYLDFDAEL